MITGGFIRVMKRNLRVIPLVMAMMVMTSGCSNKADEYLPDEPLEPARQSVAEEPSDETTTEATSTEPTQEQAIEDPEPSPFDLWEYEGYVDECDMYIWVDEFRGCDYDGDGKTDRVNRSWDGEEETAVYTIEFGNGDRLVTPKGWETGFPHIQSGDLDGDGAKEILVTLTYDTSTDPYSFGDIWLFDRDASSGEYSEVELPLVDAGENGAKGLAIEYDKPQDGKIKFTLTDAGLSRTEDVGEDYISQWWDEEYVPDTRVVFWAEITDTSKPVLRCYIAPLQRWSLTLGFNLNYNNGKYEIGYIEIDEPHSW